jgi:hypothetical protein
LIVDDTFSEGVRDITELHLHGMPICESPVNGRIGTPAVGTWLAVARTVRGYPNLQPVAAPKSLHWWNRSG